MVLPISTTVIRNALGYLQCDISGVMNHLNTIDNPRASQIDKDLAEAAVIQFGKNIGKMARTLHERVNITIPASGYTNAQLQSKGII